MCNTCNTGYTNRCSSYGNSCQNYGCNCFSCGLLNWLFGGNCGYNRQSVCRDCCGNLRIVNRSNGCNHSCNCGCAGNTTSQSNTTNGNAQSFGCYTVCGGFGNNASTTFGVNGNGNDYYDKQYALGRNASYNSYSCGCN